MLKLIDMTPLTKAFERPHKCHDYEIQQKSLSLTKWPSSHFGYVTP